MKKINYGLESVRLHRKISGKLSIKSKVKLRNRNDLSLAYTPGVAEVCNVIYKNKSEVGNLTLKKNTVAVISDGSAVLGLGNLGAESSIPVMEGKSAILSEFADVNSFPICIKSQDTEEIINIIKNISPVFGGINLEDINSPKCFEIEKRLREELDIPVMHDDQWGAGTVLLAGFINAIDLLNQKRIKNKLKPLNKKDTKIVISGLGAAGVASSRLLILSGYKNIIVIDSKGIIHKDRKDYNQLNIEKLEILNNSINKEIFNDGDELEKAIIGANVFIGLSKPGILKSAMVKSMATDPIIFALANPIPEIMPELAKELGVFIISTGRSDYPNQVNNSLMFPGFWKGMLERKNKKYNNNIFIKIANAIAKHSKKIDTNHILPDMFDKGIVNTVYNIAKK